MLSEKTLDEFHSFTKINIADFLSRVLLFLEVDYPKISRYYNGEIVLEANSFELLSNLSIECNKIISVFSINTKNFNHYEFWQLLEYVEEIREKLNTINNLGFYLNSKLSRNQYSREIQVSKRLKQFQSLENFSSIELDSNLDYQDNWVDLAINNSLREENYSFEGNVGLNVDKSRDRIRLNSVLGVLEDDLLYGKDIDKKFVFEDNDLKVLSTKDTLHQTIDILLNLEKGDNPQYLNLGISRDLYVGNALASLSLSTLIRELTEIFGTDDTISSFRVLNINRDRDALIINLEIETKFNEVYNKEITL